MIAPRASGILRLCAAVDLHAERLGALRGLTFAPSVICNFAWLDIRAERDFAPRAAACATALPNRFLQFFRYKYIKKENFKNGRLLIL